MNAYTKLKKRHQDEFNAFPMFFAFTNESFERGMAELGLSPVDTDKILKLGGMGGFMRKSDETAFDEMTIRHECERAEAIQNDKTGSGYIFDMFRYELANYEYGYTHSLSDTLEALGLTYDQVKSNPRLKRGLEKAHRRFYDYPFEWL
ncbi:MAG: hypothetical protein AB7D36_09075 [Oscillospiraceae bacterium]